MCPLSSTISVIIITKNEESNLPASLESVNFASEIVVVDNNSSDNTCSIAKKAGAIVIQSATWPGFGPQKNVALSHATSEWILSIDADEYITPELAREIQSVISNSDSLFSTSGFVIKRESVFIDKKMRFGDWGRDRVIRLFRRVDSEFSNDIVHERVITRGRVSALKGAIIHTPVKSLKDSKRKMWRYNLAAAGRLSTSRELNFYTSWVHASWSLIRGLFLRLGILDGYRGVQLAWFNAKGTFIRYECAYRKQQYPKKICGFKRFKANFNLWITDHGFLRSLYDNGGVIGNFMYRVNQPSPAKLKKYEQTYGIRTVVNLRGSNPQLGWYQLESEACKKLNIKLVNIQVYSRGLPTRERIHELKRLIECMELPVLAHCKSGADRAGIFSVLYRHFRLGEPIETAKSELSWRFGHFRGAQTGILDYFFDQYIIQRRSNQSFIDWVSSDYLREKLEREFCPHGLTTFIVNNILRRE
jgi:glycosyltransferase involved in cell wall biosynthesis